MCVWYMNTYVCMHAYASVWRTLEDGRCCAYFHETLPRHNCILWHVLCHYSLKRRFLTAPGVVMARGLQVCAHSYAWLFVWVLESELRSLYVCVDRICLSIQPFLHLPKCVLCNRMYFFSRNTAYAAAKWSIL